MKKLREFEAKAGKQVVMDRQKVWNDHERVEEVLTPDKESFPLEAIPRVRSGQPCSYDLDVSRCRYLQTLLIRT